MSRWKLGSMVRSMVSKWGITGLTHLLPWPFTNFLGHPPIFWIVGGNKSTFQLWISSVFRDFFKSFWIGLFWDLVVRCVCLEDPPRTFKWLNCPWFCCCPLEIGLVLLPYKLGWSQPLKQVLGWSSSRDVLLRVVWRSSKIPPLAGYIS